MFYLAERLRADFIYQVGFVTITLASFSGGYQYFGAVTPTLALYVLLYASLYIVRIVHSYFLTVRPART
jgi:hypothetical protein